MSVTVTVDPADQRTGTRSVPEELSFVAPPPGMLDLRRFTLSALDDAGFLFALRSAEQSAVRLFVMPPRPYFPAYAPEVDPSVLGSLEADADDAVLLVVVHPGGDGEHPTANLLAPVVVNARTGAAAQVVLDGDAWPLRAPLAATGTAA
ncbi:flagellar assembly protein FliW [Actinotalea sp. AC32]|nr:flagellar assembly protein FliW [Actinotalea sp. AC32]